MIRQDGIFIKIEKSKKGGKIGSTTVASTKKVFKEIEEGDEAGPNKEEEKDAEGDMVSVAKKQDPNLKRRKKVLPMKKKIFEVEDEDDSSSDDEDMAKAMKMGANMADNDEAIKKQMEMMRKEKEDKKAREDALDNAINDTSSEEEKDLSLLNKKQRK
jgi:hypothetical protein